MIEIINENILHSGADIIINPVDCNGVPCSKLGGLIGNEMPWVEIDYRKYLRKHNKEQHKILGTVQFVPAEVWALWLVNTMEINNTITSRDVVSFIANCFVCDNYNGNYDVESTLKCLSVIRERADAKSTIALPEDFITHTSDGFCEELMEMWNQIKFYKTT